MDYEEAKRRVQQRQMTHQDFEPTRQRVKDAMKTMRDMVVPQTPAEAAMMLALGPVGGKAFKGASLAAGAMASDDAEAAIFKMPFDKLKELLTRRYRFHPGEAELIAEELENIKSTIKRGGKEAGFSRDTTKSGFGNSYPNVTSYPIKATKDLLEYAPRFNRSPLLDKVFDAHTHPNHKPVFSFADLTSYMREPKKAQTNFTVISPDDKYTSFSYHKNSHFPYRNDSTSLIDLEDLASKAGVDFKTMGDPGYEDWLNSTGQELALAAMMKQADNSKMVDLYYDWPEDLEKRMFDLKSKIYNEPKQGIRAADPEFVEKVNKGILNAITDHPVLYDPKGTAYVTMTRDKYLDMISKELGDGDVLNPEDVTSYDMGIQGIAHRIGPNGEFIDFDDGLKPGLYAVDDERYFDDGGFTKTIYNLLP
jgi:hypothetical protein